MNIMVAVIPFSIVDWRYEWYLQTGFSDVLLGSTIQILLVSDASN